MADTNNIKPDGPAPELPELTKEDANAVSRMNPRTRRILLALTGVLVISGFIAWNYYSARESTDDAQIDGHINPISARVGGMVIAVNVNDNQQVEADTVLVEIDPTNYQMELDRAKADLEAEQAEARAAESQVPITSTTTESRLSTAKANVQAANAQLAAAQKEVDSARAQLNSVRARLREAQARNNLARQSLDRMRRLVADGDVSQQQYDIAVAESDAASAAVESVQAAAVQTEQGVPVAESHVTQAQAVLARAEADLLTARMGPQVVAVSRAEYGSAQAKIEQQQANLAQTELNLQYTKVKAPVRGVVSKKSVELGQVIQPGQPLMTIVPLDEVWVTANFKETQLENIQIGQPVEVSVDTYGGYTFQGHVDSIAPATGAKFSVLPSQNTTGNFVKVVQRIPVKIVLEKGRDPKHVLRPGMSVVATVITK